MHKEILMIFVNALIGVVATAVVIFFRDRLLELYNSTFYGKLLDEAGFRKKSGRDFYYEAKYKPNHILPLENISFKSLDHKYRMDENIPNPEIYDKMNKVFGYYKLYCKIKGIQLFNGKVARLSNVSLEGDRLEIETQELEYFDYIKSHLLADAYLKNFYHLKNKQEFKSFRGYIESKPELCLKLARTLGVNVLVVTRDHKLILQKRSKKTNIYGGTTYPSASGSLEYKDSIVLSCISSTMKKIILGKELFEEVAVFPADIMDMGFIGIYEDLYRLRLPDMFFIATVRTSFDEVKRKYEADLSKDKFETEKIKGMGIDEFFHLEEKSLSQPLRVYYKEKELILQYLKQKGLL